MRTGKYSKAASAAFAGGFASLLFPVVAAAQGCALCYQSAAASGARAILALQHGIVVLLVPPFFICSAMTYLVYRRRNAHNENG